MLRKFVYALCILICFILQTTFFRALAFGGIVPNLLIILTASIGFMRDEKSGLIIGFFAGLIFDIFFSEIIGFQALIFMYIGFLNGFFSRIFYPEDIKLPMALIVTSNLSYGMINYVFLFMLRGKFNFAFYFRTIILPEVIYTLIITCALYPLLLVIERGLDKFERKRARKFV